MLQAGNPATFLPAQVLSQHIPRRTRINTEEWDSTTDSRLQLEATVPVDFAKLRL